MKKYFLSIMTDRRNTPDAYIVRPILTAISFVYRLILGCVYFFYRSKILPSYKVKPKVISIGNITLGGTGKTPFTIKLAGDIKAMGKRPAVLTRGYGNDESHLLQDKLKDIPVLIGRDRVKNARLASDDLGCDCIVLDDGFQHYRLKRDLDIVLIDSTSPFENMRLFPRGLLREPPGRLKEADIAVITKSDMGKGNIRAVREALRRINDKIEIAESYYKPVCLRGISSEEAVPLSHITGRRVAVLSGIASPAYFAWMLGNAGACVMERFYYPDHHNFTMDDMDRVKKGCIVEKIDTVVTTEKDAVRLKRLESMPDGMEIFILEAGFNISSNEEALVDRLHSVFNS